MHQSADLVRALARSEKNEETLKVLSAALTDAGLLEEEDHKDIYDYENAVAESRRLLDEHEREVTNDLREDINRHRVFLEKAKLSLTTDSAKAELENVNMKYLNYSRSQLQECLFEMFSRLGLLDKFHIDQGKLRHFFADVERNYYRVPYHHFTHAFNITHVTYYIIRNSRIQECLEDLDVLAVLLASLGHDIGHKGANNVYYQKTRHELALISNDIAILENYHCYMLFKLL